MRQATAPPSVHVDCTEDASDQLESSPRKPIRVCLTERDPSLRRVIAEACDRAGLDPCFVPNVEPLTDPTLVQMEALSVPWEPPRGVGVLARRPAATARLRLIAAGARRIIDVDSSRRRIADSIADIASATDDAGREPRLEHFDSRSPAMLALLGDARRLTTSRASVLITGETGVGKEHLGRAIHEAGPRRDRPFVVVNCGALPESLLESQLFGHERGAFTGADRLHRGFFETAQGSTLLLDEIGDVPKHLQVKLLNVLQNRVITRLGGTKPIEVDVRVMAATNRDLEADVASGRFREDLFYRLNVVQLHVPPLRERAQDLPELAGRMLRNLLEDEGKSDFAGLSERAFDALRHYRWPGNLRELDNVLQRAIVLGRGPIIDIEDLPHVVRAPVQPPESVANGSECDIAAGAEWDRMSLRDVRDAAIATSEKAYLRRVLEQTGGVIGATAKRAGIRPRSLYDKMRRYDLRKEDFRS